MKKRQVIIRDPLLLLVKANVRYQPCLNLPMVTVAQQVLTVLPKERYLIAEWPTYI